MAEQAARVSYLLWLAGFAAVHVLLVWTVAILRAHACRRQRSQPVRPPYTWPSVSVLVPAWQERNTIERSMAALQATEYPQVWEALVIAGGPDGTLELAQELCSRDTRFCVLRQDPLGKNAALNRGLSVAKGEIIALLDADSEVSPGWLRALVAPLDSKVRATTGNPHPLRQTPISLGEQMERISAWEVHGATTLQGSGSIAFHRQVIEGLGRFPEHVSVGVDWDLNARLEALGLARAFCPQAVVRTQRPATLGEYWRNDIRWRRAHFTSLLRLHDHFLNNPVSALTNLYIYGLAWFTLAFSMLVPAAMLVLPAAMRGHAIALWLVFVGWLLVRRAALAAEVAVYKQDWRWLKLVWVPPLLLIVTLAACVCATLTWQRQTAHFKGPRPQRSADDLV